MIEYETPGKDEKYVSPKREGSEPFAFRTQGKLKLRFIAVSENDSFLTSLPNLYVRNLVCQKRTCFTVVYDGDFGFNRKRRGTALLIYVSSLMKYQHQQGTIEFYVQNANILCQFKLPPRRIIPNKLSILIVPKIRCRTLLRRLRGWEITWLRFYSIRSHVCNG